MTDRYLNYSLENNQAEAAGILRKYVDDSAAVRAAYDSHLGLKYGPLPDECMDVFTPSENGNAPVVAFFHGGWWKANNRVARACLAAEYLKRGYGFASIGYPLAPEHSLAAISRSARNAVSWLYRNARSFGLDPSKIVLSGNSAGGHLAALAGSEDELAEAGVPAGAIAGIVSLSGIYDLGLLAGTEIEQWLPLDASLVQACSPIHHLPSPNTKVLLLVGASEPEGFKEQIRAYAAALENAGRSVVAEELAGHSHFSIVGELGRPGALPFEFSTASF